MWHTSHVNNKQKVETKTVAMTVNLEEDVRFDGQEEGVEADTLEDIVALMVCARQPHPNAINVISIANITGTLHPDLLEVS